MELMKAGITMSVPTSSSPGMISEEYIGEEVVCLATKDVYVGVKGTLGALWVVPKTSTNPEAAMKFLELMYTDEDIIDLLAIGIEGRDYVVSAD